MKSKECHTLMIVHLVIRFGLGCVALFCVVFDKRSSPVIAMACLVEKKQDCMNS